MIAGFNAVIPAKAGIQYQYWHIIIWRAGGLDRRGRGDGGPSPSMKSSRGGEKAPNHFPPGSGNLNLFCFMLSKSVQTSTPKRATGTRSRRVGDDGSRPRVMEQRQ